METKENQVGCVLTDEEISNLVNASTELFKDALCIAAENDYPDVSFTVDADLRDHMTAITAIATLLGVQFYKRGEWSDFKEQQIIDTFRDCFGAN